MSPVKRGETCGAAIRLHPFGESLAVTEGIETGLAIHFLTGLPTWASISAVGMEAVILPDTVRCVFIMADLDKSSRGEMAGIRLRNRLVQEGRKAHIFLPGLNSLRAVANDSGGIPKGCDWADVLAKGPSGGATPPRTCFPARRT